MPSANVIIMSKIILIEYSFMDIHIANGAEKMEVLFQEFVVLFLEVFSVLNPV